MATARADRVHKFTDENLRKLTNSAQKRYNLKRSDKKTRQERDTLMRDATRAKEMVRDRAIHKNGTAIRHAECRVRSRKGLNILLVNKHFVKNNFLFALR